MNEQQEKTSELNTCSDCKYREKLFHEHPCLNCTNALGIYENYEKEDLPDFGKMKAKFNEMCLKQGVNVLTIEKDLSIHNRVVKKESINCLSLGNDLTLSQRNNFKFIHDLSMEEQFRSEYRTS